MTTKSKVTKKGSYAKQDREDNRKFLIILAVTTILLIGLIYYLVV